MEWKKEEFFITVRNNDEIVKRTVKGIVSNIEEYEIGIHKADGWIITDISTGYQIQVCQTQKSAKIWVEDNFEKIKSMLAKPAYKKTCRTNKKI